ncbi:unnamed protein product [Peniophora sp. CBMAI 1063]|nr:unnamed protein product [Peniophora sp. CBMAI 1063]
MADTSSPHQPSTPDHDRAITTSRPLSPSGSLLFSPVTPAPSRGSSVLDPLGLDGLPVPFQHTNTPKNAGQSVSTGGFGSGPGQYDGDGNGTKDGQEGGRMSSLLSSTPAPNDTSALPTEIGVGHRPPARRTPVCPQLRV